MFNDKRASLKRPTTSDADITDDCSESKRSCTDDNRGFDETPSNLELSNYSPKSPPYNPKSPDYDPQRAFNSSNGDPTDESVSVSVLKTVTASIPTDFTKTQSRVQNYGYDFKVLGYFDVEPNYNSSVLQQPAQPLLCPVVNGTLTSNKNVLTDDIADIYFDNNGTATNGEIADIGGDPINAGNMNEYVDGRHKCKQFGFTKTKRNYTSMYLNINNVPVLCNKCYGLNCVCNE